MKPVPNNLSNQSSSPSRSKAQTARRQDALAWQVVPNCATMSLKHLQVSEGRGKSQKCRPFQVVEKLLLWQAPLRDNRTPYTYSQSSIIKMWQALIVMESGQYFEIVMLNGSLPCHWIKTMWFWVTSKRSLSVKTSKELLIWSSVRSTCVNRTPL